MNPMRTGAAFSVLTSVLALSTPAAAGVFETAAHCLDGASVQSDQGSSPSASCTRGVSEFGPPYRFGATDAQALVTSSLGDDRFKQGVSANAKTILNAEAPDKLLGARAFVSVFDADWFTVSALSIHNVAVVGGRLFVNLRLHGTLLVSGGTDGSDSFSSISYAVELENGSGETSRATNDLRIATPGIQSIGQDISVPATWTADGRIDFSVKMIAVAQAFVDRTGAAQAASSFASSLDWLGIDRVTDQNGVPVASFLAINPDTGVNWGVTSPVPEPAVWLLFTSALPLIALQSRKRRRDSRACG